MVTNMKIVLLRSIYVFIYGYRYENMIAIYGYDNIIARICIFIYLWLQILNYYIIACALRNNCLVIRIPDLG